MRWTVPWLLLGLLALHGCGGGSSGTAACSIGAQKQAVFDLMHEWYFFNDEPAQAQKYPGLDLSGFASAEELLSFLRFLPDTFDRNFSFITTATADQLFFGEGAFVGFGFGSKFVDSPTNDDLRLTQVFAGSPAQAAGFERGFRIMEIDGRSIAEITRAEGVNAALGPSEIGFTVRFRMRDLAGVEFEAELSKALVTMDPVPFSTVFDVGGAPVGYVELRSFISTAEAELDEIFSRFEAQGVSRVIVDLRYNGGGLVEIAERLANLLGGFVAGGQVFSQTRYNSDKTALNSVEVFQLLPGSLSLLQQVVFITSASSASASELVVNGLAPHTVVGLVGDKTFGKPVGQSGFGYCDDARLLRAVTFEVVNALGEGRFFDGLDVDCAAGDELDLALGDPAEQSLATALQLIETGACPMTTAIPKPTPPARHADVPIPLGSSAARRLAGAF